MSSDHEDPLRRAADEIRAIEEQLAKARTHLGRLAHEEEERGVPHARLSRRTGPNGFTPQTIRKQIRAYRESNPDDGR